MFVIHISVTTHKRVQNYDLMVLFQTKNEQWDNLEKTDHWQIV